MASSAPAVRFAADGMKYITKTLKELKRFGGSPKPVLNRYGAHLRTIPRRSVAEQKSPTSGRSWKKTIGGRAALRYGSGALVSSYENGDIRVTQNTVRITPKPKLAYHNIHQYGGTIRPRRAKFLWFPLNADAKRAGGIRAYIQKQAATRQKPFYIWSRNGNRLLVYRTRTGSLKAMFVGKKRVIEPARPYAGQGARDRKLFVQIAKEEMTGVVRSAWR